MTSRQSQIGFSKLAPSLVARDLRKVIGKKTIVDGISFELFPGEVFGFLGPNGAGKTTTIRMLVGLIKPTKGFLYLIIAGIARYTQDIIIISFTCGHLQVLYNRNQSAT